MPNELMLSRMRHILVASTCILFATWPVFESWAGWQRDMVMQGWTPPTAPRRSESRSAASSANRNESSPIDSIRAERIYEREVAEAKREHAEKDKLIQKNWVPVSPTDTVIVPGNTVSIAPGSHDFNTVPSNPGSFTAPIAHVAMKGTPIPKEALRRAVAILAAAEAQLQGPSGGNPPTGEEIAFLASQAALALEGAPLQVIVSEHGAVGPPHAADTIRPIIEDLGQQQAVLERAITTLSQTLKANDELKKEQDADGNDPPRNIEKHRALTETYDRATGQAKAARKRLDDDNRRVRSMVTFSEGHVR
jgi:hypothetical protein